MTIQRYILKNYLRPLLFSTGAITFVFVMDFIIQFIELFLEKGVALHVVLQMFALSLAHMFALIIPMAVLPATLMTFGNLASENEITAMKACGVSVYRIIAPALLLASVLALGLVFFNNRVLPNSNHRLLNLMIDVNRKKPTVELRAGRLISDLPGYTIYFREKDDRTGRISEAQIFKHNPRGLPTSIVAEKGRLVYDRARHMLRVELDDGEIHELPEGQDRSAYRITKFHTYTLHIKDVNRSLQHTRREYRGDREMSAGMMRRKIKEIRSDRAFARIRMIRAATERMRSTFALLSPHERRRRLGVVGSASERSARERRGARRADAMRVGRRVGYVATRAPVRARSEFITGEEIRTQIERRASLAKQIDRYLVEIHKKYSIPFACIVFILIGVPLALRTGQGMAMAIGLSMVVFVVYYVSLIGGEKLADRALLSPWLSMWAPNVLFGLIGVWLIRITAREQRIMEFQWRTVLRFLPRRHAPSNSR